MKSTSKILTALLSGAITLFALNTNSSAQTLSALDGGAATLNVNTIPTTTQGPSNTGSTGTDGSYFFDVAEVDTSGSFDGDLNSLPTYVTSVSGNAESASGTSSLLTVGGNGYHTGRSYDFANDTAPITLATITLGSSIPSSFNLGLLADNFAPGNTFYSLALFNNSNVQIGLTTPINSTVTGNTNQNDFYYANVQGAGAGDYIKVYAAAAAPTPGLAISLGGVTFDTVTAPEPTTWALLFAGVSVLILVARRKVSASRL